MAGGGNGGGQGAGGRGELTDRKDRGRNVRCQPPGE